MREREPRLAVSTLTHVDSEKRSGEYRENAERYEDVLGILNVLLRSENSEYSSDIVASIDFPIFLTFRILRSYDPEIINHGSIINRPRNYIGILRHNLS